MTTTNLTPADALITVFRPLKGLPGCIAGSMVAAEAYNLPLHKNSDVDVFCYSSHALIAAVQRLLQSGFFLDDRYARVWHRWLRYGIGGWHTNSIKLTELDTNIEVNVVFKTLGKNPVNSLSQVLESFDFGLLGVGIDLMSARTHDLRPFLFPDLDPTGPLPLMPNKRDDWRAGFISEYNGIREVGRYGKYAQRGFDLTAVKDDLVEGYWAASVHLGQRDQEEKRKLGKIFEAIAMKIESDAFDELVAAGQEIQYMDSLDQILDSLE